MRPAIQSNKPYAQAQLLKQSDLPHGWTRSGTPWVGTSVDDNSSSMFTMTQFPDIATCMGMRLRSVWSPPRRRARTSSVSDDNTDVFDVADVYTSVNQAKSDFPAFGNQKFANCFLKVEGSGIIDQ